MKSVDPNQDGKPVATDSGQDKLFLTNPSSPPQGEVPREVPSTEGWIALCARAAVEQDPKKLLDLVIEINRLLDARRKRLLKEADGTSEGKTDGTSE